MLDRGARRDRARALASLGERADGRARLLSVARVPRGLSGMKLRPSLPQVGATYSDGGGGSAVLTAMGVEATCSATVRLSVGRHTTPRGCDAAARMLVEAAGAEDLGAFARRRGGRRARAAVAPAGLRGADARAAAAARVARGALERWAGDGDGVPPVPPIAPVAGAPSAGAERAERAGDADKPAAAFFAGYSNDELAQLFAIHDETTEAAIAEPTPAVAAAAGPVARGWHRGIRAGAGGLRDGRARWARSRAHVVEGELEAPDRSACRAWRCGRRSAH